MTLGEMEAEPGTRIRRKYTACPRGGHTSPIPPAWFDTGARFPQAREVYLYCMVFTG